MSSIQRMQMWIKQEYLNKAEVDTADQIPTFEYLTDDSDTARISAEIFKIC